jgi:hypothetical protein
MRHLVDAHGLARLLRSAPYDEPAGTAQVHPEREACAKVQEEVVQLVEVDKLNGAVEEMTQATADSYRSLLEAS